MASVIMGEESPSEDFGSMQDEDPYDEELEEEDDEELNNAGASTSRGGTALGGGAAFKIINQNEIHSLINEVSSKHTQMQII